jgi:hypothetical protein
LSRSLSLPLPPPLPLRLLLLAALATAAPASARAPAADVPAADVPAADVPAADVPAADLPAAPAAGPRPRDAGGIPWRVRVLEASADTLDPGKDEFHLGWLTYHRGLLPGLQLSTQLLPTLASVVNLTARVQLLEREELRATAEVGAYWMVAAPFLVQAALEAGAEEGADVPAASRGTLVLSFPAEVRATVPLAERLELNLATQYRALVLRLGRDVALSNQVVSVESTLGLYDAGGAWLLTGRLPVLTHNAARTPGLAGGVDLNAALTLDAVNAWSVQLGRDQLLGESAHLKVGLGWRASPGVLLVESLGHALLQLDLYWR